MLIDSDIYTALLLHALLPPNITHFNTEQGSSKKKITKSTIKDSQDSFLIRIASINNFNNSIDKQANNLKNKKLTLQPLIVYNSGEKEYYVYFDDIKYKFNSFLPALDCCFKLFYVLNLKYPECSKSVWIFIQKYLFGIDSTKSERICPNVLCLIRNLS